MLSKIKTLKPAVKNEDGFTIIDILIAIVVLGVLIAISIPVFNNYQKASMEATLKTDLRNAALALKTESTKTFGRTLAYIPNFATTTSDNRVELDTSASNAFYFCLVGTNGNIPDKVFYYSSKEGKISTNSCPILPGGGSTTPVPGKPKDNQSFDVQKNAILANKKLLQVVHPNMTATEKSDLNDFLKAQGYGTIIQTTTGELNTFTQQQVNSYDVIVIQARAWGPPESSKDKMLAYYEQGGKVIVEGNDSDAGNTPFIEKTITVSNTGAAYIPTMQQGLNPAFPYTFTATAFGSDANWMCIERLTGGAVSLAITKYADRTCSTMFANANSNGGQWVTLMNMSNPSMGASGAAFNWIISY